MQDLFGIISEVFLRVVIIYIGVLAGFIFIKSPLKKYRKQFIEITINILTPVLIFVSFLNISLEDSILYPVVSVILVTVLGIYIPKLIARVLGQEPPSPAELCTSTFPNALNFPFPIIFAFAPDGLGLASIFLGLSIIARNTVGFWISGSKIDKQSLKQIALFPPIWAIILGIITRSSLPSIAETIPTIPAVNIVFEVGIFMTLMTIGFGIQKPKIEYLQPIVRTGITRFVIMGLIGYAVIQLFRPTMIIAIPFLVQLMAPPAVYNGLYAEKLGLDTKLTAQVIITLTLLALILLPLQILSIQYLL